MALFYVHVGENHRLEHRIITEVRHTLGNLVDKDVAVLPPHAQAAAAAAGMNDEQTFVHAKECAVIRVCTCLLLRIDANCFFDRTVLTVFVFPKT